jgi:nucleoside-specific outer membrane channel protein Tsx
MNSTRCAVRRPLLNLMACGLAIAAVSDVAHAEEYSNTNVQLFMTNRSKADAMAGTGTTDERLTSFKFEHYGTFKYGDNYFFLDDYHGKNVGGPSAGSYGGNATDQQFGAWMPRVSIGKLLGQKLEFGPVADISLAARIERGSYGSFKAEGYGVSADLKVPTFDYVMLRVLARDTNYNKRHPYIFVNWGNSFNLGPVKAHFDGYLFTTPTDANGRQWFAEPELTVDLDPKGTFQGGVRLTHDSYKLQDGSKYSRNSPQLMLRWNL